MKRPRLFLDGRRMKVDSIKIRDASPVELDELDGIATLGPATCSVTYRLTPDETQQFGQSFEGLLRRHRLYRLTREALAADLFDWTPMPVAWLDAYGMRFPVMSFETTDRDRVEVDCVVGPPVTPPPRTPRSSPPAPRQRSRPSPWRSTR